MNNGTWNAEKEEELENDEYLKKMARRKFEDFIEDRTPVDRQKLLMEAFDGMLFEKRRLERSILNTKREKEYEKNRPPQDKWYEMKTPNFSEELYRNRMDLKPNDQNKVYLETLKDNYLY